MNTNDFGNIMNNGFQVEYIGETTKLRCFECGEPTELKEIKTGWQKKWKISCKNNHQYDLVDFLVLHINMRDGAVKEFFKGNCNFEANEI